MTHEIVIYYIVRSDIFLAACESVNYRYLAWNTEIAAIEQRRSMSVGINLWLAGDTEDRLSNVDYVVIDRTVDN
jgi:hypothetical protein